MYFCLNVHILIYLKNNHFINIGNYTFYENSWKHMWIQLLQWTSSFLVALPKTWKPPLIWKCLVLNKDCNLIFIGSFVCDQTLWSFLTIIFFPTPWVKMISSWHNTTTHFASWSFFYLEFYVLCLLFNCCRVNLFAMGHEQMIIGHHGCAIQHWNCIRQGTQ
jgi:hypothetical protein